MRIGFQEDLDQLEASIQEEATLVAALAARRAQRVGAAGRGARGRSDRLRRRGRLPLPRGRERASRILLARQTPVASDLRLVLAMLHVNLHLERIGDYCVTIAKLVEARATRRAGPDVRRRVRGDGRARRGDDPRRTRLLLVAQPRAGRDARRPRRADRPDEPALRRAGALDSAATRSSTSGACG